MKWPLKEGHQLKTWVAPLSKLLIIGDAAHAMLPYMSQGAAMAVEDGAALAVVLDKISSLQDVPYALKVFEKERIKRSSDMQNASRVNGLIWHFPDGAEQRARDEGMTAETMGLPFSHSSNQWSDPVTQWWAYGYDAEKEMEKAWARDVALTVGSRFN
jgi:salicylate hydroxylase